MINIQHGHPQGGIGTGAEPQMDVRSGSQPVDPGIDYDQTGAALHQIHHRMSEKPSPLDSKGALPQSINTSGT